MCYKVCDKYIHSITIREQHWYTRKYLKIDFNIFWGAEHLPYKIAVCFTCSFT